MGGSNWVRNVLTTACLFCGPLLVVFSFLNTVAIAYGVSCSGRKRKQGAPFVGHLASA